MGVQSTAVVAHEAVERERRHSRVLRSVPDLSTVSSWSHVTVQQPLWPSYESTIPRIIFRLSTSTDTIAGLCITIVIIATILLTICALVLQSLPTIRYPFYGEQPDDAAPIFSQIEFVAVMIFTVEYGLKFVTVWSQSVAELRGKEPGDDADDHEDDDEELGDGDGTSSNVSTGVDSQGAPKPKGAKLFVKKYLVFIFDLMNIIDLVAILPFYIALGSGQDSAGLAVVRVLRVVRIFRVFKLGRYSEIMNMLLRVFGRSAALLANIMFFIMLLVVLFGSLIYFTEGGEYNAELGIFERPDLTPHGRHESPFVSIFSGCYWLIQTATTVGFGDFFPTTIAGRIIAVVAMMLSLAVVALPVTVIADNFTVYLREYEMGKKVSEGQGKPESRANQLRRLNFLIRESHEVIELLKDVRDDLRQEIEIKEGVNCVVDAIPDTGDSASGTREPSENYLQAGARFRSERAESAPPTYATPLTQAHNKHGKDTVPFTPGGSSESSRVRFSAAVEELDLNAPDPPHQIELARIESQKVYRDDSSEKSKQT